MKKELGYFLFFLFFFGQAAGQCGFDFDSDGICDEVDNCRFISNPAQSDVNGDGIGDFCSLTSVLVNFAFNSTYFNDTQANYVNAINTELAVPTNQIAVQFSSISANVVRVSVRITDGSGYDDLASMQALYNLLLQNSTIYSTYGFYPLTTPTLLTRRNDTRGVNCAIPGCAVELPVTSLCHLTWFVKNNQSFSVAFKALNLINRQVLSGIIAPGENITLIFNRGPGRLQLSLSVEGSNDTIHPPTVATFNDNFPRKSRCLVVTPVCKNVYKVQNNATERLTFLWQTFSGSVSRSGVGGVDGGSYTFITTFGGVGEKINVFLADNKGNSRRKEDRIVGKEKSCFPSF